VTFRISTILMAGALSLAATAGWAKDDLTIAIQLEPPHLDPTSAAAGAIDSVLYSNVFEGLTRFASDGSIIPGLAASWDISADGLTYTFHLHDGVKFHDGATMDAEDVIFSLDRARAADSANAQKPLFAGITSVTAADPLTVTVTLAEPNGAFPFNMAWGDAVIVEAGNIEGEAIKQHPVGTGAFKFVNWVQGDKIELAKNPDYWGTPAKLDRVTFRFISDPTAAFGALMAGDIDAFAGYPGSHSPCAPERRR
jgi:peptide/nickel transport system substrate-binding protein